MRFRAAYLLVAAAVLVPAASTIAAAATKPSKPKSIVLGKTATYPPPGCPNASTCEVVARVTGIQMMADGVAHPFRAPKAGTVVSWWLKLPHLSTTQMRSFNSFFGGDPAARIAVVRRGIKGRFRLIDQGPTTSLKADLGKPGRVRYRLAHPLHVQAGDYVGLTAVTWVPAFAVNLDATQNYWLASRARTLCATPSSKDPRTSRKIPAAKKASTRPTTSRYHSARRVRSDERGGRGRRRITHAQAFIV